MLDGSDVVRRRFVGDYNEEKILEGMMKFYQGGENRTLIGGPGAAGQNHPLVLQTPPGKKSQLAAFLTPKEDLIEAGVAQHLHLLVLRGQSL